MERKNIAFQYGIHRSPSAANDGELAECVNLEAHNGELTPSVMPQVAFTLTEGDKLLFVHKSGNYKNYIIQRDTKLCWFSEEDKETINDIAEITPTSIHAVGNTLVILSEGNMEYVLFKSGKYKRIGNKPPFCSISFGLCERRSTSAFIANSFTVEGSANDTSDWFTGFKAGIKDYVDKGTAPSHVSYVNDLANIETENFTTASKYVNAMTESMAATLNKIVSSERKFGAFMHPFFLRYAYRMYDGSHYMHSAPVFFPVNMMGPVFHAVSYKEDGYDFTCNYLCALDVEKLDYRIAGLYDSEGNEVSNDILKDWEDIIKGLDVFVSSPIYPYKQDGYVTGYWGTDNIYGSSLCTTGSNRLTSSIYTNKRYSDAFPTNTLAFEMERNEDFVTQLEDSGQFYKVAEFKDLGELIKTVSGVRLPLTIKEDTLSNLEQQEPLDDDYDSHDAIIPSFAHVYNGRLNISGIRTKLFAGFPMESMVPYTFDPEGTNCRWSSSTKLEIDGREIEVVSASNIKLHENPAYVLYPSTKVKKFTLYKYESKLIDGSEVILASHSATFDAKVHKLLNGSFYLSTAYGIGDDYKLNPSADNPKPSGDPYIVYPNKLYTSEVNNPFYFPLSGRNSVGTGEIIGITSNTQAISPGQFGEYPLIVFSSDGVWALQTGEEGLYYSIHPISKDICTNPNILQTDGPVLFATENGLHSIVGSNIENISKHVKGKPESIAIPAFDNDFDLLATTATDDETFNDFIQNASLAYDYANSRVLIFKDGKSFAYVLSTESGTISKLVLISEGQAVSLGNAINAYPEVFMQSGKDIYTFVPDKDNTTGTTKGVLVTRTMAFADPLAMKVVNDVRLIYHRSTSESKCRYAMFVSNDGYRWAQRNSLRGHSFKFFRFVVFTELADTDALQGMSVMFDYRRTNKLR